MPKQDQLEHFGASRPGRTPPMRPLPQEPFIIGSWGPMVLAIGCAFAGVVLLIAAVCSRGQ